MKKLFIAITLIIAPAVQAAAGMFYVPVNRSEIVTTSTDLSEVIVSNPDIADVFVHGKRSVSVIGKSVGITSVKLFDEKSKLVRELDVQVTYDLPAIRKALHEFLPYEHIGVKMVNTKVALTGEVSSAEAVASAMDITRQYITADAATTGRGRPGVPGQPGDDAKPDDAILNLLKVRSGQQVMLRIRFGEINRSTIKALGTGLNVARTSGDLAFDILSPSSIADFASTVAGTTRSLSGTYEGGAGSVTATLDALERDNLLKVLAEPNLVAVSGETAEFLSGGEIPIPTFAQDGQVQVQFKPFGVSLRFTPFVLSQNRIRIQVQPEVSSRNDANGVPISVNGVVVPAFDVRRASTTVELAPGESFMIAGLLEDTLDSTVDQLPGVNEIPVFSSLFRSTRYNREETELVIAVTPYLVDPLQASDVRLPTDDFRPASFMDSILYGALGSLQGNIRRVSQTPTMEGPVGFMVD